MTTQSALVPSWGPTVTSHFSRSRADLLYVEQMIPSRGDRIHIYWSGCNFYFEERGGYAGLQHQNDNIIDGVVFRYNNICSIWDLKDTDPSLPPEVQLEYGAPGLHWSHFGGEGTGLHTSHPMPWAPDHWYGLVIRRWYVYGENITHMAMFIYSYAEDSWTHYMSAAVPGVNLKLTGTTCAAFLERFNGDALAYEGVYGQHFRMLSGEGWEKPSQYVASGGEPFSSWEGESFQGANVLLRAGGTFDNDVPSLVVPVNQFDSKPKPANKNAAISDVRAACSQGVLTVSWTVLASAPPQLGARIRIEDVDGNVLATDRVSAPHLRQHVMSLSGLSGNYWVHVVVEDIFDQDSNDGYAGFAC
ncbi:MAG: DUF3472 domain-containing protein [Luteibacter jiangsuensis]